MTGQAELATCVGFYKKRRSRSAIMQSVAGSTLDLAGGEKVGNRGGRCADSSCGRVDLVRYAGGVCEADGVIVSEIHSKIRSRARMESAHIVKGGGGCATKGIHADCTIMAAQAELGCSTYGDGFVEINANIRHVCSA